MQNFEENSALYNRYAEYNMIGFCNIAGNGKLLDDMAEDDFSDIMVRKCVKIIKAIENDKQNTDVISFNAKASVMFENEKNELFHFYMACIDYTPTDANKNYIKSVVKECAARRKGIELMQKCIDDLANGDIEYSATFEKASEGLKLAEISRYNWINMPELMKRTLEHISKVANGEYKPIRTQISTMDKAIGGFFEGELTVIGARPGVGKSAFAGFIALNAAKAGKQVCVCSREMSDIQYGQRVLSNIGDIDGQKFRTSDLDNDFVWEKIATGITGASELKISFMFSISAIEDLRAAVRKKCNDGECDILIVDYLQLLRTKRKFDMEHLRVGYISKILKDMSLDLNIPIIALAQVRRSANGLAKSRMPGLDELKDSGSIEQDADGVIFLHRPTSENDDCLKNEKLKSIYEAGEKYGGKKQLIIANVAKQRQGETGAIAMMFEPGKMQFEAIRMER